MESGSLEMRLQLCMYHHLILFLVEKFHQHSCSCAWVCVCEGGVHISHRLVCELEWCCTTSQDHIEVPLVISSVSYVCRYLQLVNSFISGWYQHLIGLSLEQHPRVKFNPRESTPKSLYLLKEFINNRIYSFLSDRLTSSSDLAFRYKGHSSVVM